MGVVYHGRYFEWFEAARTEWLRDKGMPYRQLEEEGIALPVVEAYCRYRRSVLYDELVRVVVRMEEASRSRVRLSYCVLGEAEDIVRVEGYTVHCYMNPEGKPMRVPEALVGFLNGL
jgi:acyl-CoA thioester hydrolase